ncbi:MAG: hypothetical protein AAF629_00230 [Chloroflexota bacterium]
MKAEDYALVADWHEFVYSGFQPDKLTRRLYQYLDEHHNPEEYPSDDRATFWATWFQNLYNLYTFLSDFYETVPSSNTHQALQRVLDPVFAEIIEGLNGYEVQIYTEIRDDEVAANLEEACRMNPGSTIEQVRADLCYYFDESMYEWFYSDYYCELEVTDAVFQSLAQKMNTLPDIAHQSSVFELRHWLDSRRSDEPVNIDQMVRCQSDLFTQIDQSTSAYILDLKTPQAVMEQDLEADVNQSVTDFITDDALIDDEPGFDIEKIKRRLAASPEEEAAMMIDPRICNFQPVTMVAALT